MGEFNKIIFIISNEPWGDFWFSKHHYANELAKLGNMVFFLDPPARWRPGHLFLQGTSRKKIDKNLTVLAFRNALPTRPFRKLSTCINDFLNSKKLNLFIKAIDSPNDVVIWQFDYLRFVFFPKNGIYKRIYHVADPYMETWQDTLLSKKTDLIVCTSPKYVPYYERRFPRNNIMHVAHGISGKEQMVDYEVALEISEKFGEYILLIGTINDDLDFDLLGRILKSFKVVMAGSVHLKEAQNRAKWEQVRIEENLHFLGIVHAKKLNNYVSSAKLCVLLYKFSLKKTLGTGSPLKILNYLAQYKPIISSIDPEIPALVGMGIYWAKNESEFLRYCQEGMSDNLEVNKYLVKDYLDKHQYPDLIKSVLRMLDP